MANPAKRRVDGSDDAGGSADAGKADDPAAGDSAAGGSAAPAPKVASKRVTPSKSRASSSGGRYTAPSPTAHRGPSPRWVPILMFALWGLGLLVIILNYMGVMPGTGDEGSGWYLIAGLGAILGGIIVATQYR